MYAAGEGPPRDISQWNLVSAARPVTERDVRYTLNTAGRHYRWYLVWITKLGENQGQAKVSEIFLYR